MRFQTALILYAKFQGHYKLKLIPFKSIYVTTLPSGREMSRKTTLGHSKIYNYII